MLANAEGFVDTFDPLRGQKKYSWEFKNSYEYQVMRHLMKSLLTCPFEKKWTVQGLGMMRCYLDEPYNNYRVNVWDASLRAERVSTIHTHPWDFLSWVINGMIRNTRYTYVQDGVGGFAVGGHRIKCGINGGPIEGSYFTRRITAQPTEVYTTGDVYWQHADEVHSTNPASATVTLNFRRVVNGEDAFVFWHHQDGWVDAKPREATRDEILRVCTRALANWDVFEPGYTAD